MPLSVVPCLAQLRGLLDQPRGFARFQDYLRLLTDGTDELVLPISAFNPMSKEHVAALLDRLLSFDAEHLAADVCTKAAAALGVGCPDARVCLLIADELHGGWTNRATTELHFLSDPSAEVKRHWLTVPFWSSAQHIMAQEVVLTVAAGIFRRVYLLSHGAPRTIRDFLQQEGFAALSAQQLCITSSAVGIATACMPVPYYVQFPALRSLTEALLSSSDFPTLVAFWCGDDAAEALGYPRLGFPVIGRTLALPFAASPTFAPATA